MGSDGKQVSLSVDRELYLALEHRAGSMGLSMAQTVRDLLRYALNVTPSEMDRGWREGYTAAFQMVQKAILVAIANAPPTLPGE